MDYLLKEYLQEFSGATDLHNEIISTLIIASAEYRADYKCYGDGLRLVYQGDRKDFHSLYLASHTEYDASFELFDYDSVEPDFMIFHKNTYALNKQGSRIAGQPILIVEVWSRSNTREDRHFKKYLYSTSFSTEHWYIEQNSNEIECYLGKTKLPSQSLSSLAKTSYGLELDLSPISLENRN